jgi:hypothetical protein
MKLHNTLKRVSLNSTLFLLATTLLAQVNFTKVDAGAIGVDQLHCQTLAWGDYDSDGFVDLFAGFYTFLTSAEPHRLYHNNGDGTFTRVLDGGIANDMSLNRSTSAVWMDIENDGDLDLYITQSLELIYPALDQLYLNNGDGTFVRGGQDWITFNSSSDAAWADHDNDGLLDLCTGSYQTAYIFHQQNDGSMVRHEYPEMTNKPFPALTWSDYDNDNDLDLFIAGETILWRNDGDGIFTANPIPYEKNSQSLLTGDYDNDGDVDLVKTIFKGNFLQFYENNGDGTWTEKPGHISMPGEFGYRPGKSADYDNDGYLDLLIPTSSYPGLEYGNLGPMESVNLLLHNEGDGTFTKVTEGPLVNDFGMSFACGWADYDNDGDLDVALVDGQNLGNQFQQLPAVPVALYRNDGGNQNNWLSLTLVGTVSNRSAIGAKVLAKATIRSSAMQQMREVSSAAGGWGQSDLRVHFGLGDATIVDELRIEWPSGGVQVLNNVEANQFMTIEEEHWGGFVTKRYEQGTYTYTDNWMGILETTHAPWVWCFDTDSWLYIPEDVAQSGRGWMYEPLIENVEDMEAPGLRLSQFLDFEGMDVVQWAESYAVQKYFYIHPSWNGWVCLVKH